MAQSTDTQRTSYPLAAYNFRVKVDETSMSFTEVSGLAVEREHVTYAHGLSFQEGPRDPDVQLQAASGPSPASAAPSPGQIRCSCYNWLEKRDSRSMEGQPL